MAWKRGTRKLALLCKRISQIDLILSLGLLLTTLLTSAYSLLTMRIGRSMCLAATLCSSVYVVAFFLIGAGLILGIIVWAMTFKVVDRTADRDLYWGMAFTIASMVFYIMAFALLLLPVLLLR